MSTSVYGKLFLWGALGGIIPTVAKLASTYVTVPSTPLPEVGLLLGIALWAVVGGVIALTNPTEEVRAAIFAGIAAPAILTSALTGVTAQRASGSSSLLSMSAFAQELSPLPTHTLGSALIFDPTVSGGLPSSAAAIAVTADIKSATGKVETVPVGTIREFQAPTTVFVPPGALNVYVGNKPIPPAADADGIRKLQLHVTTSPSNRGDFLWALGLQRKFKIDQVSVSPASVPNDSANTTLPK